MRSDVGVVIDQCGPKEAWDALASDPEAQLVDVRTRPEWSFVGVPDLSGLGRQVLLSEWRVFPEMRVNERFAEDLLAQFGAEIPAQIFFICRSGARSMEAATRVAEAASALGASVRCVNVAEGFEGDLDGSRHRGVMNGWKARGLAWIQS